MGGIRPGVSAAKLPFPIHREPQTLDRPLARPWKSQNRRSRL